VTLRLPAAVALAGLLAVAACTEITGSHRSDPATSVVQAEIASVEIFVRDAQKRLDGASSSALPGVGIAQHNQGAAATAEGGRIATPRSFTSTKFSDAAGNQHTFVSILTAEAPNDPPRTFIHYVNGKALALYQPDLTKHGRNWMLRGMRVVSFDSKGKQQSDIRAKFKTEVSLACSGTGHFQAQAGNGSLLAAVVDALAPRNLYAMEDAMPCSSLSGPAARASAIIGLAASAYLGAVYQCGQGVLDICEKIPELEQSYADSIAENGGAVAAYTSCLASAVATQIRNWFKGADEGDVGGWSCTTYTDGYYDEAGNFNETSEYTECLRMQ
jgi:hypothetical protein